MAEISGNLKTSLWLDIKLRHLDRLGYFYTIIQKGPDEGGAVLLKVFVPGEGAQVFSQYRDFEGDLKWMEIFERGWVDEHKTDAYITRQISFDPDLWAVEVELREKANPLDDSFLEQQPQIQTDSE